MPEGMKCGPMNKWFASLVILFSSQFSVAAGKVVVGYFTKESAATFESKIKPMFARFAESCPNCELRNLTPYNDKGEYQPDKVGDVVAATNDVAFFMFDWNERASDQNKPLSDLLSKQVAQNHLVLAAAGVPPNKEEGSCPLAKTMMGQVTDAIIVGELTDGDRLLSQCYYGPEMLTAVRPPHDLNGQGFAALNFAAHWAHRWEHHKPQEWLTFLRARKAKSKRIWPELEEFFPR